VLTAVTFSMFGFIIGRWADSFQKLQAIPLMIVTPLTFLGGAFYSISMLPPFWQKVTLFNPVVYLISAMRWAFYGTSDVNVAVSVGITERAAQRIVADLDADGYITTERVGRRNHYVVHPELPLRHPVEGFRPAGALIEMLANEPARTGAGKSAPRRAR